MRKELVESDIRLISELVDKLINETRYDLRNWKYARIKTTDTYKTYLCNDELAVIVSKGCLSNDLVKLEVSDMRVDGFCIDAERLSKLNDLHLLLREKPATVFPKEHCPVKVLIRKYLYLEAN